jgi:hypothetical protein
MHKTATRRARARTTAETAQRGYGIIPVLAAFAVISVLCVVWAKSSLARSHDQRLREERTQVQWLAEAGVRRGAARLAVDSSYRGETWDIAAAELGRRHAARVIIRITTGDQNGPTTIEARASYPGNAPRVTQSKRVTFVLPSRESSS